MSLSVLLIALGVILIHVGAIGLIINMARSASGDGSRLVMIGSAAAFLAGIAAGAAGISGLG